MGGQVSYEGKPLGNIKPNPHTYKWEFYAENLESLQTLFRLPDDAVVDVENSRMSFKEFREMHLKDISTFYPSLEAWFLHHTNARTVDEFNRAETEGRIEKMLADILIIKPPVRPHSSP